jgi:DNA-binding HxlR family transcriptional regulator
MKHKMSKEEILKILPKQGDLYNPLCPSRSIIGHVSSVWGSVILKALAENETMRFAELRRQIEGISERMLAQTLRHFERDGLVTRKSYPVIPPKVEYSLTPLGRDCAEKVISFCSFIEDHMLTIVKNQLKYDETPNKASWQKLS